MGYPELEKEVKKSLEEGYSIGEIVRALKDDGYSQKTINRVLKDVRDDLREKKRERQEGKSPATSTLENDGGGQKAGQKDTQREMKDIRRQEEQEKEKRTFDLKGDQYTVVQGFLLRRYKVYDGDGNLIMKAKKKLFQLKEEIPFSVPGGDTVFRVKAEQINDRAGDYTVKDEESGEEIALIDRKFTLLFHSWRIRKPDDEAIIAKVEGKNRAVTLLRYLGGLVPVLPNLFALIPHKYIIMDNEDSQIGEMDGRLSLRDTYDISIDHDVNMPRESLLAAVISIDALEGN